jgi:hypothetical protein
MFSVRISQVTIGRPLQARQEVDQIIADLREARTLAEKLLKGLKQEPFDQGKLTYIENFAAARPLSCEQAATLLKCFAFDEGRIKAVKLLYPRLIDRQNFNDVLSTFVFDKSKAEARKAVGLK